MMCIPIATITDVVLMSMGTSCYWQCQNIYTFRHLLGRSHTVYTIWACSGAAFTTVMAGKIKACFMDGGADWRIKLVVLHFCHCI